MVCTLVKASCLSPMQDPKHLHLHCNSLNNKQFQQLIKARKHEFDCDCPSCDMRAIVITEQFSPTSLRLAAANSPRPSSPAAAMAASSIGKRNASSGKRPFWDFLPCEGQLPIKLLLLFGLLLCFSFILAICTLDASMRLHATGKKMPVLQERRSLMGFHIENRDVFNSLGYLRHHDSPSRSHLAGDSVEASSAAAHSYEAALHGLGIVFSKGTKSMPNLIIANLEESCEMLDFRLFLRTLYRSGAMAKADLVLLFPWPSLPDDVSQVLQEEEESFKKLLKVFAFSSDASNTSTFGANVFGGLSSPRANDAKNADKRRFIMWGENNTYTNNEESYEYGSVVGFHMNDLDPADGFSDFLINPPAQLRRWLCYQMLLGLLRFRFRLVMLVDLGGVVILDDVFSQAKKKEFLYLSLEDSSWADTTTDCCQGTSQAEARQDASSEGIEDDDQMVLSNPHEHNTPSVPLRNEKGIGGAVHEPAPNKKGIGGARKKKTKIPADQHTKGLLLKRKKQEMVNKSSARFVSGDKTGKDDVRKERKLPQKIEQETMGKAMNINASVDPPDAGALREGGYMRPKLVMMEMVYGKEVWECLEQAEKQRKVVSSRVILGSMRSTKRLANSMAVEIVRVALQRNSKLAFPDGALLSYLAQKSSHLLGKRTTDSLQLMGNGESMVHSLDNSEQKSLYERSHDGQKYSIVQASSLNVRPNSMQSHQTEHSLMSNLTLSHLIRADICASSAHSTAFYDDCGLQ